MRILYHHRIVANDGMRVHVTQLVEALRGAGHEVFVVGPEPDDPNRRQTSLTVRFAGLRSRLPSWITELLELAYNAVAYRRLNAVTRTFRPDIVYERHNLFLLAGIWLKNRRDIPLLLEVNAPLTLERQQHGNLRLVRLASALEDHVWRRADAVLAVSDILANQIKTDAGVPLARLHVIRNGVARRDIAKRSEPSRGHRRKSIILGFLGFARAWHGLDRVLRAMGRPKHAETELVIIGDGPVRTDLERTAHELGLSGRLRFTGHVPHQHVRDHLAEIDIALQPDVTPYASPLKLFDYMAAGCAIVAPDRPNIQELLTNRETALLFNPDHEGDFEAKVEQLLGDPELRKDLGDAARHTVSDQDWTWEGNAERVARIAEELGATGQIRRNEHST